MKDFALKLKGCSKADRKKVIDAMKQAGLVWYDKDRFKDGNFKYLVIGTNLEDFFYYKYEVLMGDTVYQMPHDWNEIQEALGIEDAKLSNHWSKLRPTVIEKFDFDKQMRKINDMIEKAELKQTIETLINTADMLAQENAKLISKNKQLHKDVSYWHDGHQKSCDLLFKIRGMI